MIKNKILGLVIVIIFSFPLVLAQDEPPIYVDISQGECANVDLNADGIPDVIICYNEDDTITIDDVIAIDESVDPIADGNVTLIVPSSITTIRNYELPFDEEELKNEIIGQYSTYIYILGGVILLCLVLIVVLFNKIDRKRKITRKLHKKRKKRK
tara:strand:+ start:1974 stop:2438 length:465 start_codon:yes stop_codon:yes gene_type:complete